VFSLKHGLFSFGAHTSMEQRNYLLSGWYEFELRSGEKMMREK